MSARPASDNRPPRTLILGIGNVLWADEGFGVRVVERLHRDFLLPQGVTLLDGGTQGIYLVDQVRSADVLVVFDAVDYGLPPGSLKRVVGDQVPRFMGAKKMSLHQTGFQDVLALAELLGDYPRHLLLIGVQPVELDDYGGSLRPAVKAQIDPAIRMALAYLENFGVRPQPRGALSGDASELSHGALQIRAYEAGRPPAEAACRVGDARFLPRMGKP